jgi:ubiquinone/menaquinone biosynthesis C-methylase UbiE
LEAKRILKKGGKMLILDWMPNAKIGPVEGRIWPEDITEMAEKASFKKKKEFSAGAYHYGLIFEIK